MSAIHLEKRRARSAEHARNYAATGGLPGSHSSKVDWLGYLDVADPGHGFTMAHTRRELVTAARARATEIRAARRQHT